MSEGHNCFIIINLILFSITVKYLIHNVLALIRYDVIDLRMLMPVSSHEIVVLQQKIFKHFPYISQGPSLGLGVMVFTIYNLHFICKLLCIYWHFSCSGSSEFVPYFHNFAFISHLKRVSSFISMIYSPLSIRTHCTNLVRFGQRNQKCEKFTEKTLYCQMDGQQVIRKSHFNLQFR